MKEGKFVVLCIDDDQDLLDSIRIVLESKGYLVQTADSAEAGLKCYKSAQPDLVIVDLMMEEADSGITFVRKIKALGATPPIYLLSSVGDALTRNADFNELGLTDVLQKPIIPDVLLKAIGPKLKQA